MLITPRPGVNLDNLVQNLESLKTEAFNLKGGSATTAQVYLLDYLDWAGRAARTLGYQISETDLAALVLNRRYETLLSSFGTMTSPLTEAQRVVRDLVRLELDQRVADFEDAIKAIQSYRQRWTSVGDLVVLDTGFYIRHPEKLEEADIAAAAGTPGAAVHVLVPMVVVDQLDGLKQASKPHARWRAGYSVAVFDRVFKNTSEGSPIGRLRREDNTTTPDGLVGQGEVTMELLFDPPGHVRLPIADDEIIDRGVAVQTLAGRSVTLVAYDTGMSTRARNAGLRAIRLQEELGEEPEREQRRSGSNSRRGGA